MSKLIPIEHQNQRILTTKQLAEVYETEEVRIQQNFIRNKDHFIEGKHFYMLKGEELKAFKANYPEDSNLKFVPELTLWTARGANRHCKILDTDKAWEQFDTLEETYFNPKQLQPKDSYMIEDPIERAKAWIIEAEERQSLTLQLEAQRPKVIFAEALEVSNNTILIGELAKILRQNGIEIGQNRLFEKLRKDGYLIKKGENYNQPTQYSMELGLFEIKKRTINNPDGSVRATTTTKCTSRGMIYFINKFKAGLVLA